MRRSPGVIAMKLKVVPAPDPQAQVMFRVKDLFTTHNGQWFTGNEFNPPQWAIDEYFKDSFSERGGATHIFARVEKDGQPLAAAVAYGNRDPQRPPEIKLTGDKPSYWQNLPIYDGFDPGRGEEGWWDVSVNHPNSERVTGIALPWKWHISTFVVFEMVEQATPPVVPPLEPPDHPTEPGRAKIVINLDRPTDIILLGSQPFTVIYGGG